VTGYWKQIQGAGIHIRVECNLKCFIGNDNVTCLWDVGTGEVLAVLELNDIMCSVNFNLNGEKIVSTCKDKITRVHDARTLQVVQVRIRFFTIKDGSLWDDGGFCVKIIVLTLTL